MFIRLFQRPLSSLALEHGQKKHIIYSSEEFKKILIRERARADRCGREFSVIAFEFSNREDTLKSYKILAEHIFRRIRLVDEFGWFDKRSLGLLLIDVTANNAWKVVEELRESLHQEIPIKGYQVLSYPSNHTSNNGSARKSDQGFSILKSWLSFQHQQWQDTEQRHCDNYNDQTLVQGLEPLFAPPFPIWKRAMDVTGSLVGITLLFPLFLVVALMIKTISPGPVFFKQQRIGRFGRPFTLWKFRTMMENADFKDHKTYVCGLINNESPMNKMDDNDSKILPFIGKTLRNLCIDELPQLLNVLRGEMSLVGPRPCLPYEFDQYLLWHKRRILTVPGMTGLWQVSGKNRTTFKEMIRFDIAYENQRSFWLDMTIIIKTIWVIADQLVNHILLKEGESDATYV